jgi:hypothetical protein
MHGCVQMGDRMMGYANVSGYDAPFQAFTGDFRAPGPSDFDRPTLIPRTPKNQIEQGVSSQLHGIISTR